MADTITPPEQPDQAAFAVIPMVAGDLGGGGTGEIAESSADAGADEAPPAASDSVENAPSPPAAVRQPPSLIPPTAEQLAEASPPNEPAETVPPAMELPTGIAPPIETRTETPTEPEESPVPSEPIVVEPVTAPEPKPEPPVEIAVQPETPPVAPTEPATPAETPTETADAPAPTTNAEPTETAAMSGSDSASDSPSAGSGMQLAALPEATGSGAGDAGADGGGSGSDPALAPGGGGALDDSAMRDYAQLLGEWLDRHKEYPDRARKRNQQGVVLCEFTMAADGVVLSHRILESSGFPLLDEEIEALFERASPLPVPPAGAELTYTVPIVFALN